MPAPPSQRRVRAPGVLTFRHAGVLVIESLPAGDLRTGTRLFEDVVRPACSQRSLFCAIECPQTAVDFRRVLRRVQSQTWIPILHLETHACEGGLELASGDFLPWEDLHSELQAINIRTENNLAVVISACFGVYALKVFTSDPLAAAPVRLIVGPEKTEQAGDLEIGFKVFYRHILEHRDPGTALKVLKRLVRSIRWYSADQLFADAMNRYLEERGDIQDSRFEEYKRRFFMVDLFPELDGVFAAVSVG